MTAASPTITLNNGAEMPALGLGVFRSSAEDTTAAVKTAIDTGENFAVFDFSLTDDERDAIDALNTGVRGGADPNHYGEDGSKYFVDNDA